MAKIVPPLVFRKQAEYDGKYDAVSECELRPHETFKLLRAHALQQLYIICHANNGSLWKTKRRRGYHYFHVRDVHSHQLLAHVRRLSLRRSVKFHTMSFPFPPMLLQRCQPTVSGRGPEASTNMLCQLQKAARLPCACGIGIHTISHTGFHSCPDCTPRRLC